MKTHSRQLPIPDPAFEDAQAVEMVRVWMAFGNQHVSIATGVWTDPAAWGMMLVDLAKHVANAYEQTTGKNRSEVLLRIREGFDAEWEFPTDDPKGSI
jgi:hypothetical protein